MNISLKWLKRYIDLDMPIDKISEILTAIGLEVEGIEEVESIKGGLQGIVVGKVISCEKHPNADKLSKTTVDIGRDEPLKIVCGAPNVAEGQKVVVATIGTKLYTPEGEEWKIKKGKIRGELSEGMICAEDELGLGNSHDGIMVLDSEVKEGTLAAEHFNVSSDFIFDIGLTPNRSDATSHYGVAKDLMAYLKVNHPNTAKFKNISVSDFHVDNRLDKIDIEIVDKEKCPRFSGLVLSDIEVKPSPQWMRDLLSVIGVQPINNIVDITNFVLHEYGQPLHAYDASKVSGSKVIITTLDEGTKFKTLDDVERKLRSEDIMVCDGDKNPLCIAGVFGGAESGVTDSTKKIFLESAYFNAKSIRQTSTKHLLRTDAAQRFEKGADPNITVKALKRAAILMKKYAGATISSDIEDKYPKKIDRKEIVLRYSVLNDKIGEKIEKDEVNIILQAMEMEISLVDSDSIKVKVPTNKADVLREVDLVEEVLRIYGFNRVSTGSSFKNVMTYTEQPNKRDVRNLISDMLVSKGYYEMMNLSLIESKYYRDVLVLPEESFVVINNTSNIHLDIMRPEMMISGLLSVLRNHNHQQKDLRLFELGKTYIKSGKEIIEKEKLSIFLTGNQVSDSWLTKDEKEVDFYDIKKIINELLNRFGLEGMQTSELSDDRMSYGIKRHRGNIEFLKFGAVKNVLLKKLGIKMNVFYAEIDIEVLFGALKNPKLYVEPLSKYPAVRRDLACVVDKSVKFEDIERLARKIGKKLLKEVSLFDIYENEEQLGKGNKSYAVKYIFQDNLKTMKDKDIDKIMNKIIEGMGKQLNAHIRK